MAECRFAVHQRPPQRFQQGAHGNHAGFIASGAAELRDDTEFMEIGAELIRDDAELIQDGAD